MSRKGKEKGDDASGLWQLVAEMQAIANFTNKWPIGKSHVCDYVTTVTNCLSSGRMC